MSVEKLKRVEEHRDDYAHFGLVGKRGGVHFRVRDFVRDGEIVRYGGIEKHSKTPFEYSNQDKPDNEDCWLIGCPCWHDGSSLIAQERYIPVYEMCLLDGDFEPIWLMLEEQYENWIGCVECEAGDPRP